MTRSDGSVIIKANVDVGAADKQLAKLRSSIKKTEAEIEEISASKKTAEDNSVLSSVELDREQAKLAEMKKELEEIKSLAKDTSLSMSARDDAKSRLPEMKANISDQSERVKLLKAEYNKVTNSVEQYDKKLISARKRLEEQTEEAGELANQINSVNKASLKMANAQEKAQKNLKRFNLRLKEVARSALVFTLITRALAKFREWAGKVIMTNEEARESIAALKAALLTMAQPLIEYILPAFVSFVNVLTQIVTAAGRVLSAFFGKTYSESQKAAESLNKETNALDELGASAEDAAGSLAGFDEVNKIVTENAKTGGNISPDFSQTASFPDAIEKILSEIELIIDGIRISWNEGKILKNKDAMIVALSAILGAMLGGIFGGFWGSAIGLILGVAISLTGLTFVNDMKNPELAKKVIMIVLASMIGAVLGGLFGGLPGAAIGFLLGALISLGWIEFQKGETSNWDSKDTVTVVLSAIIGAVLGSVFGGIWGAAIGFLLGAIISFVGIKFSEGKYSKDAAIASLRIALIAILGAILGTMFGGFVGGVVGLVLGLTIGFATVAFDKDMVANERAKAANALKVVLSTIIGALIGTIFGGGIFGGIVGGVIGLTFGLAVTLNKASIKNETGFGSSGRAGSFSGGYGYSSDASFGGGVSASSIPALATGAVVPPNREFMAILGDNKTETEVVSPLSTMKQAMLEAMQESGFGGEINVTVVTTLDGREVARNQVKHINAMTQQAGKSVLLF